MKRSAASALLPAGLLDLLPSDAAFEASVVERLAAAFEAHGYERVKPPLLEFETSLLAGAGAAMAEHTFRLMDPVSQRMMGLRADMTPQVARIAATRLKKAPRPLRLSYAGQVLRVRGSELRPARQLGQAGVELIGAADPAADAEVILLAAEALAALGVAAITVDLNLPTLVPVIGRARGFEGEALAALVAALDRRDSAAIARAAGREAALFGKLQRATGPADRALGALQALALPPTAAAELDKLVAVVAALRAGMKRLSLTIDPVEHRGFEYHNGVGFSLFANRARSELGRGGRYVSGEGEPSTGFSLYLDALIEALPAPAPQPRIYLPPETAPSVGARLRREGWITLAGFGAGDPKAEARRLGCTHLWRAGRACRVR
ncbi:MAG: ATP phosphoribosyltransferase regulatory subunit [Dongiaceae bacterium]